jgi:outer membrane protein assembly factor BamB
MRVACSPADFYSMSHDVVGDQTEAVNLERNAMRGSVLTVVAIGVAVVIPPVGALASPASPIHHGLASDAVASQPWRVEAPLGRSPAAAAASASSPRAAARAWMADQRDVLQQRASATTSQVPPESFVSAAGHLGGRNSMDVFDTRTVVTTAGQVRSGITARVGRSGKALWQRTFPDGGLFVVPARVGPLHEPGAVVFAQDLSGTSHHTVFQERVWALSGTTGRTLWSQTFTGSIAFRGGLERLRNLPFIDGVVHDISGRDKDVLITVTSGRSGGIVTPFLLSGVNGAVRSPGGTVRSRADIPSIWPVPDETGDRLGDLLIMHPGSPEYVRLIQANSARSVWTRSGTGVSADTFVQPVGTLSRRSHPFIAITNLEAARPSRSPDDQSLSLLNGGNGRVLWTRNADFVIPLGVAGSASTAAVGLGTFLFGGNSGRTESVRVSAVTPLGRTIYRRTVALTLSSSGVNISSIRGLGDVQPDGSQDTALQVFGAHGAEADGVISGRTGTMRRFRFTNAVAGSLHRGIATDLVRVATTSAGVWLTGRDGATGTVFYGRLLPDTAGAQAAVVRGLRVTGHRCSDLSMSVTSPTDNTVGLLSARGQRLWTVTYSSSQAVGGTLNGFPSPARFCVR